MRENNSYQEKILFFLKKRENFVSGQTLASCLNISRQAVNRNIAKLKKLGYKIISLPHRGYLLRGSPDKFYPWEIKYNLSTETIGKEIFYYEKLSSTQDIAYSLALKGAPEGGVVVAQNQTQGRGRFKRKWVSPPGGIYLSCILKPKISLTQIPKITFLGSLAALYALKKISSLDFSLKWPNDIFLEGKKIAGVLCEIAAEADKLNFVILGLGLNINTKDLPSSATSLFLHTGKYYSKVRILKEVLKELDTLYLKAKKKGFSFIVKEWEKYCFILGKKVSLKTGEDLITGIAKGLNKDGYLLIKDNRGFLRRLFSGEVVKVF